MGVDEHVRAWALIPLLVNGRASAPQRRDVEQHLARCAGCRAELDAQRRLQQAIAQDDPSTIAGDAEAGLQRLFARLDQVPEQPAAVAATASATSTTPAATRPAVPRRWLPAALAAAVVVQSIGLALLGWRALDAGPSPYAVLSTPPAAPSGATLRVVPDPALPLQQWHALLQAHHLRIADGPSGAGAYALAPLDGAAPTAELLQRLRAAPGIRLAEALSP
jgi:hypothetical protein